MKWNEPVNQEVLQIKPTQSLDTKFDELLNKIKQLEELINSKQCTHIHNCPQYQYPTQPPYTSPWTILYGTPAGDTILCSPVTTAATSTGNLAVGKNFIKANEIKKENTV